MLVGTQVAENLGAAARIMRNLGVWELVLVAPEADPLDRRARQLSTHGEIILDRARIVPDLASAVSDCLLVVATSARTGKLIRGGHAAPREVMPRVIQAAALGPTAIVFGPERDGLTDKQISRCHYLIHIPADPTYPALNLAQSVAICLYELRCAWLNQQQTPAPVRPAPFAEQDLMFARLERALQAIHFLYGRKGLTLMHALRHLLGRAQPTETEVGILLGLARQIHWYVEKQGPAKQDEE